MSFLDFLPRSAMLVLLVGAVLNGCHSSYQRSVANRTIAGLELAAEKLRADTALQAAATVQLIEKKQSIHAAQQQNIVDEYTTKIVGLATSRHADSDRAISLRDTIASYSSVNSNVAHGNPPACEPERDRLNAVAGLLAEGAGLVIESQRIIERRDAEVSALASVVANDRGLLRNSPTDTP